MQEPIKKIEKKSVPPLVWLILTVVLLGVCVFCILKQNKENATPAVLYREMSEGNVIVRDISEVTGITVECEGREAWTVIADGNGGLKLASDGQTEVDADIAKMLLEAAAIVSYEDILTEEPADYRGHEAEFGLEKPMLSATYRYTDGSECTLHIGMESVLDDETYYYMLIDGDDRLFAADHGTVQVLMTEQQILRPVTQPGIQTTRIDRITVEDGKGQVTKEWLLDGQITDADVTSRWLVNVPFRYPADAEKITELIEGSGNLYLGTLVADEPDPDALTAYGLDQPNAVLRLHMATGDIGTVTESGEYLVEEKPEEEVTFILGKEKNEMVCYALYEGSVYTMNRFQLDVLLKADARDTAARYPVNIPFADLAELTVEQNGQRDEYRLEHNWETDENGETTHLGTCWKNNFQIDYAAFEAAYERLRVATVSGALEEGEWNPDSAYKKYTFRTVNGGTHTTAFAQYDHYHDAVICDGYALWYIARGSMTELP